MSGFCNTLKEQYGFKEITLEDRPVFDACEQGSQFFDLSFTNFWVWENEFHYVYKAVGDCVAVVYEGLDAIVCCNLFPGPSQELSEAVSHIKDIFDKERQQLMFEYVPEQWLEMYRKTGFEMDISADRDWSDYIYDVADFIDLEGGKNKFKRRELTSFQAQGAVEFRSLSLETFDDALLVFDRWCSWHNCGECIFGCERTAFRRLRDIWDERYYGGVAYLDGEPVAFAVAETLNGCACYPFQKNSGKFRGLTYYLSYQCACLPGHPPLLNWCEDMGLEGLKINKLRFRPSRLLDKYTIILTNQNGRDQKGASVVL